MGDAADDLLDRYESYMFGWPSYEEDRDKRWCRFCEEGDLHWEETADGWRLFNDDGEMHNCLVGTADVDDFEDVSDGE